MEKVADESIKIMMINYRQLVIICFFSFISLILEAYELRKNFFVYAKTERKSDKSTIFPVRHWKTIKNWAHKMFNCFSNINFADSLLLSKALPLYNSFLFIRLFFVQISFRSNFFIIWIFFHFVRFQIVWLIRKFVQF